MRRKRRRAENHKTLTLLAFLGGTAKRFGRTEIKYDGYRILSVGLPRKLMTSRFHISATRPRQSLERMERSVRRTSSVTTPTVAHGKTSAGMLRQIVRVSKFWREYAGQLAADAIDDKVMREFIPWRRDYYASFKKLPKNAKRHPTDKTEPHQPAHHLCDAADRYAGDCLEFAQSTLTDLLQQHL
jgi:hypothetical protein